LKISFLGIGVGNDVAKNQASFVVRVIIKMTSRLKLGQTKNGQAFSHEYRYFSEKSAFFVTRMMNES
jgi:hypothetical protein